MRDASPDQLRSDLLAAWKRRDDVAVTALRTALAALANAEARPLPDGPTRVDGRCYGDVPRLALSEDDERRIVRTEVAERRDAAAELRALGQDVTAARLEAEAAVIDAYLTDSA